MVGTSALGYCRVHKIDLMMVGNADHNLVPTCVRCVSDAEPKLGRTQTVEDPGEEYFTKNAKTDAKVTIIEEASGVGPMAKAAVVKQHVSSQEPVAVEDIVGIAVAQLKRLPMPEDIKEFKRVQKIIKTLQSLVENPNV